MSLVLAFVGVVALTVGVLAYARGYKAGVAFCTKALDPVLKEVAEVKRLADWDRHISEDMRQEIRLKMLAGPDRETRH